MSFFDWAHRHWIMTVLIVLWALVLTTVITVKVFFAPVEIPATTVTAFGTLFGLPGIAVGLWKWRNRHAHKVKTGEDIDTGGESK